jgi:chemotaxis protein methyltransferase CheR
MAGEKLATAAAADSALLREFELSDHDFQRIRRLVRERLGIALAESKRELVYGRLSRRLRALKLRDFGGYLQRIESGDADELQHFCNAITTHLTSFFRESHHFEFLAQQLLPALGRSNRDTRRIRVWSAGCSTGEEAYSIAMVLLESMPQLRDWDVRILATDIDTNVLSQARSGLYGGERLEKVGGERVLRWFDRAPDAQQYTVRDEVKRLISFKTLNLMDDWPMKGPIDVIFCRNVVIYFDREIQRGIIGRMAALQRPDDHLILGHSESLLQVSSQYRLVGDTIHRRLA